MNIRAKFQGFDRDLLGFLSGLGANNNKAWFEQNRRAYEELYLGPAKQFVADIAPRFGRLSANIVAEPRVNGSVKKINRDLRFSRDRTPYTPALRFYFWEGTDGRKHSPRFFLSLEGKKLVMGAGLPGFLPAQVGAYRNAVADDATGKALASELAKLLGHDNAVIGGEELKRVPPGYDPGHPRAGLLRRKGLYVAITEPVPDALFTERATAYCFERFKTLRPLQSWLVDAFYG